MTPGTFGYVPESKDAFLALFSHRYDYIYAPHPEPHDRPQWQTESRHPLSDRLFRQGAYLYGVRFAAQTRYCLLDIDAGSAYHPSRDPLAISRILAALEPLGLVSYVACTSSYSQGLHLYFPLQVAQPSWQLAAAVTALLEGQGLKGRPGQLEVFPNSKLYVVEGTPTLFNAHRLPLQAGSYLLNSQFEPVSSCHEAFVRQWQQCQQRNVVETAVIEQVLKRIKRRRHRVSERADKFLNDLNAEIEAGWTAKGQTNYLLGRITMRCYVFHHVIRGGLPLTGDALVDEIVSVATSLPGYREWCSHQQEIHQRAEEWARCIENSRYFPYGKHHGKYKAKQAKLGNSSSASNGSSFSWNQQRSQAAQTKIQAAIAKLLELGQLPETATARFKKLLTYGLGGSTLYKYKSLWHPKLWKTPQTPPTSIEEAASATASPATAAYPLSLFPGNGSNSMRDKALSDRSTVAGAEEDSNHDPRAAWRQALAALKQRQKQQQIDRHTARSQPPAPWTVRTKPEEPDLIQKMQDYLRSGDPILMKEALHWVTQQKTQPPWLLLPHKLEHWPQQDPRLEALVEVLQALLRLQWSPADIRRSLQAQFGQGAIAGLSFADLHQWGLQLRQLVRMASGGDEEEQQTVR
ncbi:MAG: hypothetical protein F6J95_025310 [Leptolyngbya sp. SIO1E4]|nr:hypothetical protein [Leptolyngbya sp. SIO1E4]